MKNLLGKVVEFLKKLGYYAMQYGYSNLYCLLKFLRIQGQKWKKTGAMKKLAKAQSGLGAEVYALFKQCAADWQTMPSVQQQLRIVEEVESDVLKVDGVIDEITNEYLRKKDELSEKYSMKRAAVGQGFGEES
jgi:hypothetical protein